MSAHSSAVFRNSCLRLPVDPSSRLPSAAFEQTRTSSSRAAVDAPRSLAEFYESIPDYSDLHHLSNKEFYERLNNLKIKQKLYTEKELDYNEDAKWIGYKSSKNKAMRDDSVSDASTPTRWSRWSGEEEKQVHSKKVRGRRKRGARSPGKRTVRIDTPPDSFSSLEPDRGRISCSPWRDSPEQYLPMGTRSMPTSPLKSRSPKITIPKPFGMTVRDEEERIINELLASVSAADKADEVVEESNVKGRKSSFRAHPVPIESRIPMFDKIMADQEHRREVVKLNRKLELQSQIRPFSFTRREEELRDLRRALLRDSERSPGGCGRDHSAPRHRRRSSGSGFRAQPVPRNLFSEYFYEKMREDEYYRALKKKIRAEEMLKASSLPPSMAARERTRSPPSRCAAIIASVQAEIEEQRRREHGSPPPDFSVKHERLRRQLERAQSDFITTTPRPFRLSCARRSDKRARQHRTVCNRSREGSHDIRARSALDLESVNRSNLAAVLRIQSAKRRLEVEMQRQLEEGRRRDETRWRAKVTRRRPAWQDLLRHDNAADLSMRLQMRRDEAKLRSEEHRHRMELMINRVHCIPTLFERQSMQQFPKDHKSKKELLREMHTKLEENGQKLDVHEKEIDKLIEENIEKMNEMALEEECHKSNDEEDKENEIEEDIDNDYEEQKDGGNEK